MSPPLTVVKVGGSLFDLPDLGPRLRRWLGQLPAGEVLLVPGGGATADVVRAFDRVHHLGEEAAHWLALRAMSVNAALLESLAPGVPVLDALAFARDDEGRPGRLPHCWAVTSDSVAA